MTAVCIQNVLIFTMGCSSSVLMMDDYMISKSRHVVLEILNMASSLTFLFLVVEGGDLYSWGSNENGCLGNGYASLQ